LAGAICRRGLEHELHLSLTLPVITVELSGIHADFGSRMLVGKQKHEPANICVGRGLCWRIYAMHECNSLRNAPIAFVGSDHRRFEVMQRVIGWPSVLPVIFVNTNQQDAIVITKVALEDSRCSPSENPKISR